MRLKEMIQELIDRRFRTQTALADALNPMPDGISRCKPADIQRLASAGRNQEKQFAIFMKLIPYFIQQGLVSARELIPTKPHDRDPDMEPRAPDKAKTGTR